jgi:hypothetical protein
MDVKAGCDSDLVSDRELLPLEEMVTTLLEKQKLDIKLQEFVFEMVSC